MPFIAEILKYKSLSIIGLEKNTGKTECLNYILRNLSLDKFKVAITSIGIDGEKIDYVTKTSKPEIELKKGMYFSTTEKHYKQKNILAELLDISLDNTALGRIVTAKALSDGKVMLSGSSSAISLSRWTKELEKYNIDLTIIDGALSRKSSASPIVSKAIILSTGAALSINIDTIVNKTAFIVHLINLEKTSEANKKKYSKINDGIWICNKENNINKLEISTSFLAEGIDISFLENTKNIYITGALSDRFLKIITNNIKNEIEIIVNDFTKIFIEPQTLNIFNKKGGKITVMKKTKLIAICVNPISPNGYQLDSDILCSKLSAKIETPIYDIIKNKYEV